MPMRMRWEQHGPHVHVRVFVNGALAGKLTFTCVEWNELGERFERAGFQVLHEGAPCP